jgi:hypothetical protein
MALLLPGHCYCASVLGALQSAESLMWLNGCNAQITRAPVMLDADSALTKVVPHAAGNEKIETELFQQQRIS